MKKIVRTIIFIIILGVSLFVFTGCTLKLETSDNSVSASVDGETGETIDNVFDWIKERINRLFNTEDNNDNNNDTSTEQKHTEVI
ncbi:MAG TPA: hypothetical protein IAD08_04370 [Candidatus Scatovivens faecipullorum]|nr:hypothetical protein [Candidatus Scatovivens faecipullorum]